MIAEPFSSQGLMEPLECCPNTAKHVHAHVHACMHVLVHTCTYIMYVCMHMLLYVCMYARQTNRQSNKQTGSEIGKPTNRESEADLTTDQHEVPDDLNSCSSPRSQNPKHESKSARSRVQATCLGPKPNSRR